MKVTVRHLNQTKFAVISRSHQIICDQPDENGGKDEGMTPPELLLASLGSCAAFYATQYLRARSMDEHGVAVSVSAEKLRQPARLGNFRIQVGCPLELTQEQRIGLERSVHHCLVHNTLLTPPQIAIEFEIGEPAARV
jgi:putative redox protein